MKKTSLAMAAFVLLLTGCSGTSETTAATTAATTADKTTESTTPAEKEPESTVSQSSEETTENSSAQSEETASGYLHTIDWSKYTAGNDVLFYGGKYNLKDMTPDNQISLMKDLGTYNVYASYTDEYKKDYLEKNGEKCKDIFYPGAAEGEHFGNLDAALSMPAINIDNLSLDTALRSNTDLTHLSLNLIISPEYSNADDYLFRNNRLDPNTTVEDCIRNNDTFLQIWEEAFEDGLTGYDLYVPFFPGGTTGINEEEDILDVLFESYGIPDEIYEEKLKVDPKEKKQSIYVVYRRGDYSLFVKAECKYYPELDRYNQQNFANITFIVNNKILESECENGINTTLKNCISLYNVYTPDNLPQ